MCIPSAAAGVEGGVDDALATVSDLLGPDATYPGRNFYQQQHANGQG